MILTILLLLLDVVFEGGASAPQEQLLDLIKRDLDRYRDERRATILDDAAFRLARHFRTLGYWFAKVTFTEKGDRIIFHINEGPAVEIGDLTFKGNASVPASELLAAMPDLPGLRTPFSPQFLALQESAIVQVYHQRGFAEVVVRPPELKYRRGRMDVTFEILEGRIYRVGRIDGVEEAIVARFDGQLYKPQTPTEIEAAVVDKLRDRGYAFAQARATPTLDAEGTATIRVETNAGPLCRIGPVKITGLERTRESFVRRRLELTPGVLYQIKGLQQAEERLRETRLFRTVSVAPGRVEDGVLTIEVKLEELPPGEISISGGYGSLEGPRIGGDIAYLNVLGGGESVRLGGSFSAVSIRPQAEVAIPYLLGTELIVSASLRFEETTLPSYEARMLEFAPRLTMPIRKELNLTAGLRLAVTDTLDVEEDIPVGDDDDFDFHAVTFGMVWDSRDSLLLPTRGERIDLLMEWSPAELGSDIEFFRGAASGSIIVPLVEQVHFALVLRGGIIVPIGETHVIPVSMRYFAGGVNTVRGYEFGDLGPQAGGDPTGGELFLALQSEVRFPLAPPLHGAIFYDRGGVWFDANEIDLRETRYAVGIGLRFYTPAGAISMDLGWNVRRREGEDPVELHVSIGFPF